MSNKKLTIRPYKPSAHLDFDLPQSATLAMPDWYKKIPKYLDSEKTLRILPGTQSVNATLKLCTPFLDGMTTGYTVVLADDVQVQVTNGVQSIFWRTNGTLITDHSFDQHPGLPIPYYLSEKVWKWSNDWVFKTPPGYSTFFTHPINRHDLPFLNFTGVVDTDLLNVPVQFPFRLVNGFDGIIEKGTPIAQFFPFKRDSWVSTVEQYDHETAVRNSREFFGKINRAYKSRFWVKKTYQ